MKSFSVESTQHVVDLQGNCVGRQTEGKKGNEFSTTTETKQSNEATATTALALDRRLIEKFIKYANFSVVN